MLYKEWEKLIKEFEKSGKSQAQWCREKNLKFKAFNYQYRKYRRDNQNEEEIDKRNWKNSAVFSHATIGKKSACCSSPCLTNLLFTASLNVQTDFPVVVCLISGSAVNLPISIALFTLSPSVKFI